MKKKIGRKRTPAVAVKRVVIPQPDSDFEALKVCCNAIETCSSLRMVDATLDFLNSKYRSPGAV
jgi:hypothetical protein